MTRGHPAYHWIFFSKFEPDRHDGVPEVYYTNVVSFISIHSDR